MLYLEILPEKKLDLYSFFPIENSFSCPETEFYFCLCSSLRRKHEVLILHAPFNSLPLWDSSKRWCVGENWVWLSPRSLSFIKSEFSSKWLSFSQLSHRLLNCK